MADYVPTTELRLVGDRYGIDHGTLTLQQKYTLTYASGFTQSEWRNVEVVELTYSLLTKYKLESNVRKEERMRE